MSTTFDIETSDKVAHLQLNRPDASNSMTREFRSELPEAVRALDATGSVRALVIASTDKHFCGGMDLSVFTGGGGAAESGSPEPGRVRPSCARPSSARVRAPVSPAPRPLR